ncbi:MAG: hypothetical protein R3A79_25670 [Nannocystaceae bacterium]
MSDALRPARLLLFAAVAAGGCAGDDAASTDATTGATSSTTEASTSSSTTEASSTTAETEESSTTAETTGEPATVTIHGIARVMPGSGKFVSQGDVCFVTPDQAVGPCTTTNSIGRFTLEGVPGDTHGAVTFAEDQIATFAWALRTAADDVELSLAIDTPELVQSYYDSAGVARIDGRVVVLTEVLPASAGYAATLDPTSGDGPFYYLTNAGELDPEATASSDAVAMAVFLNVDPALAPFAAPMRKDGAVCEGTDAGAPFTHSFVPDGADILYFNRHCP